jgi:hydroxyacylglutathione hydrolase
MFQRYFDAGLAQASYLVACARTRQAVIIDPRRDIDVYVAAARQQQLQIAAAIETHIHADFVSGARELAALGVRVVAGPGSSLAYPAHAVQHQDAIQFGDLSLQFLHTPGHTPEHISIVTRAPGEPDRVFTGDTLFVAAVGRPDLLGDSVTHALAEHLFDSLFNVLLALDDAVEIHPGHGAGSLCGTGIAADPRSTIGRERMSNPMLKHRTREEFVEAVLGDLPETPPYFRRMKRMNQQGPPLLNLGEAVPLLASIPADAAYRALREGAAMIDLRSDRAFSTAHPPGALNIAMGPSIGYWAAWILEANAPILLMGGNDHEAAEVARQLLRVGLDDVVGLVEGGFDGWIAAGLPVKSTPEMSLEDLQKRVATGERLGIVDVRTPHEWRLGHIEGSIHLPVGDIPARAHELPRDVLLVTICEGGYRSSLAASLLAREGFPAVANVRGGMAAYRAALVNRA